MTLDKITTVLEYSKKQGLNAFVGGGYIRDSILGKSPKDIDVFILVGSISESVIDNNGEDIFIEIPNSVQELVLPSTSFGIKNELGGSGLNIREDVLHTEKYPTGNIDIIYLQQETPEEACSNFDCSICQCYGILNDNMELEIYVSKDFLEYINNNVIYLYSNIQTTENHIDRIKCKYNTAVFIDKVLDKDNQEYIKWEHRQKQ